MTNSGNAEEIKGRVEQAAGDLTNNEDLQQQGEQHETTGKLRQKLADVTEKIDTKIVDVEEKIDAKRSSQ